jgi:hypothetical protein
MDCISAEDMEARVAASHPDIQTMVAYWRDKAGGRRMPARKDIDPSELIPFLSRIGLVDVVDDERRFVYRLVGTADVAMRGYDPTGKSVAEGFFGPNVEEALAYYDYVARYAEPYCYRGPYRAPDGALENEDVIFLPLSEDGDTVNMILFFYHSYEFNPRVEHSSVLLNATQGKNPIAPKASAP